MWGVLRLIAVGTVATAYLSAQTLPVISTSVLSRGVLGAPYSQQLTAYGGLVPYTWVVTSGAIPPGITLAADGTLSGQPTTAGLFQFEVKLTDARLTSVSRTLTFAVAETAAGLAILTAALPEGTSGKSYTFTLSARGGVPPFRWAGGFPSFLTLDEATGKVSGTPPIHGVSTFVVTVTDAVQASASATFTLTVKPGAPALTITTPANLFEGSAGVPYSQTFQASGGAPPYQWAILSGTTGELKLNEQTGELQGTPEQAGSFPFVLQVTDSSGGTASQSYTVVVNGPRLVITITGQLPAGTAGVAYSQRLPITVTGGRAPYVWAVSSGLPQGVTFSAADQTITGTPAVGGTFTFPVRIEDAAGLSATRQLTLVVKSAALALTTAGRFPDGMLNVPYATTVEATGGQPPYRWSASGLPAGLSINVATGEISGVPTAAGEFPIAVTVVDGVLANVADRFTLSIKLQNETWI
jgi:hypothetical protein